MISVVCERSLGPFAIPCNRACQGGKRGSKTPKRGKDKYAGAHISVEFVEDISSEVINRFLADRITLDSWAHKTVNLTRQVLHKFFVHANKHHGYRPRDRRYTNPVDYIQRLREPAPQIRFLSFAEIDEQLKLWVNTRLSTL